MTLAAYVETCYTILRVVCMLAEITENVPRYAYQIEQPVQIRHLASLMDGTIQQTIV